MQAMVPVTLYNRYRQLGLLDPNHVIGKPYIPPSDSSPEPESEGEFRWVDVVFCVAPLKAYTIIVAKYIFGEYQTVSKNCRIQQNVMLKKKNIEAGDKRHWELPILDYDWMCSISRTCS